MKLYGIAEIAELLGQKADTVSQWRRRGKLPPPDAELSMGPVWTDVTLHRWGIKEEEMARIEGTIIAHFEWRWAMTQAELRKTITAVRDLVKNRWPGLRAKVQGDARTPVLVGETGQTRVIVSATSQAPPVEAHGSG